MHRCPCRPPNLGSSRIPLGGRVHPRLPYGCPAAWWSGVGESLLMKAPGNLCQRAEFIGVRRDSTSSCSSTGHEPVWAPALLLLPSGISFPVLNHTACDTALVLKPQSSVPGGSLPRERAKETRLTLIRPPSHTAGLPRSQQLLFLLFLGNYSLKFGNSDGAEVTYRGQKVPYLDLSRGS